MHSMTHCMDARLHILSLFCQLNGALICSCQRAAAASKRHTSHHGRASFAQCAHHVFTRSSYNLDPGVCASRYRFRRVVVVACFVHQGRKRTSRPTHREWPGVLAGGGAKGRGRGQASCTPGFVVTSSMKTSQPFVALCRLYRKWPIFKMPLVREQTLSSSQSTSTWVFSW